MEENSCSDSHAEPPLDVDKSNVVGNTSPYISHPVFPSVEPSSPGENNNGFTFSPSKTFPENVEDLCFLELAKLIHEIGAPLSTFSKILAWTGHWQMEGHTFKTAAFPSYATYVESLSKRLELDCLKYKMETIITPWGRPCTFPVFDFPSMFHSLLDDPRCHDNLLIDWEHPSCIPCHKIGWLDDVHSAKWYTDTHHMQIESDSNEVLCGIILFVDQTFTADNDHQHSECPLFTLSILPRHIRNQAWAWCPLGFIPKFESHHSCGQNMQALHLVLTCILSGLCGIQEICGLTTVVLPPLLSQQIPLTFKVPIAFIVGDAEGHDKLCGRYKVHHNFKQLCHECNCLVEDADDPDVCCIRTRACDIAMLVDLGDLDALKEISYHIISNAFTPLDFGANIYGINGCCPGKNLHMVQKGLMSYALVLFTKMF